MKAEICIPMLPHLMNYVRAELQEANETIVVTANSPFGGYILAMLDTAERKPKLPDGTNYLIMEVPSRDQRLNKYDGRSCFLKISQDNAKRFNELIDYLMRKDLFNRLDLIKERGEAQRKGGKMKREILKFIDKYSYPEADLTYERLKKAYYRYTKSGEVLMQRVL